MEGSASTCRVTEEEVDMLNDEQAEGLSCAVHEEVAKLKKVGQLFLFIKGRRYEFTSLNTINLSQFIAVQDAIAINKATKGFGTDEQRLVEGQ